MNYIVTDFQEIENLDYKNSTEIVENLNKNSLLYIDKIAEKLNDSSSDLKFKIFLKEEADKLYNTWKTLKESKNIKNVEVKDLFVDSYRHTYKCLEIKYETLIKDVFKPKFDAFPDNEKYTREIVWNRFSNFKNATPSKTNLKQKFKNSKYERYFKDDNAINFFFELVKNFITNENNIFINFNYIYRKMFDEKLITDIANESDFRYLLNNEFNYTYDFSSKFKTMDKIGNLEQKNKIYEYVKQNCSQ